MVNRDGNGDSQYNKLAIVVCRTTLDSLSHHEFTSVYSTMRVRQRVARVHLRQLVLVLLYSLSFQELRYALKVCNFFFTSVFVLEAAVKIISQGPLRYFSDRLSFEHCVTVVTDMIL